MRAIERTRNGDERPLSQDVLYALRYYLGSRRVLIAIGVAAGVAGLALNWSWLVASGLVPLLVAALPCLAMCALGLCMMRKAGESCAIEGSTSPSAVANESARDIQTAGPPRTIPLPADAAMSAHDVVDRDADPILVGGDGTIVSAVAYDDDPALAKAAGTTALNNATETTSERS